MWWLNIILSVLAVMWVLYETSRRISRNKQRIDALEHQLTVLRQRLDVHVDMDARRELYRKTGE